MRDGSSWLLYDMNTVFCTCVCSATFYRASACASMQNAIFFIAFLFFRPMPVLRRIAKTIIRIVPLFRRLLRTIILVSHAAASYEILTGRGL